MTATRASLIAAGIIKPGPAIIKVKGPLQADQRALQARQGEYRPRTPAPKRQGA